MKQKKRALPHPSHHRNIPVINADFREGLSPEEVRLRQQNGLRNITRLEHQDRETDRQRKGLYLLQSDLHRVGCFPSDRRLL